MSLPSTANAARLNEVSMPTRRGVVPKKDLRIAADPVARPSSLSSA
jgi:hypothetical protein